MGTGHRMVTCMAKKKGVRIIVTLECTEAKGEGATPSRYTTQKVRDGARGRFSVCVDLCCSDSSGDSVQRGRVNFFYLFQMFSSLTLLSSLYSLQTLPPSPTEQEEHPRACGAHEVQREPAPLHPPPRDQVIERRAHEDATGAHGRGGQRDLGSSLAASPSV